MSSTVSYHNHKKKVDEIHAITLGRRSNKCDTNPLYCHVFMQEITFWVIFDSDFSYFI